jgi:hypothetical protein
LVSKAQSSARGDVDRRQQIRRRQDSREITVREAADLRVEALSEHLAAMKALRAEYFPGVDR